MNREQIIRDFHESGFWNFMNFKLVDLQEGTAVIKLYLESQLKNIQGILHGGAIMSLIDTSMGMAARSIGAERVSTIQLEVRFIDSVVSGSVIAESTVIHQLKSTCIIECRVKDEAGNLVALSTSTFKK
ncbi:PaaI family thioesterase [Oceanobacillus damuensis]|uniref:PaaI family thioesterase n=1 Tax=Oceanobacillus damuensis TaxID=937928 RepID=UPI000A6609F3|nr:PaaI family thioesterase [Oceanobacillus damuensis]